MAKSLWPLTSSIWASKCESAPMTAFTRKGNKYVDDRGRQVLQTLLFGLVIALDSGGVSEESRRSSERHPTKSMAS
jgi:hypothetical protein